MIAGQPAERVFRSMCHFQLKHPSFFIHFHGELIGLAFPQVTPLTKLKVSLAIMVLAISIINNFFPNSFFCDLF
jgi:hypothetical protein